MLPTILASALKDGRMEVILFLRSLFLVVHCYGFENCDTSPRNKQAQERREGAQEGHSK